jgi:hypothetical protein
MTEQASLPFLSINPCKYYTQQGEHNHLFFKVPTVQNNHHKKPQTQHQYTVQISHNSLRKTQTTSNPEPKVDSKGRVTIMDGRVRNPYLEKLARGRKLDCIPPSRPNNAEQQQPPEPKPKCKND